MANGSVKSYDELLAEFQKMLDAYRGFEWQYVFETYKKEFRVQLTEITKDQLLRAVDDWEDAASSLHGMILEDSKKEFGSFARIGYGLDQTDEAKQKDFEAVRGTSETNSVVQKLAGEAAAIRQTRDQFKALIASISL